MADRVVHDTMGPVTIPEDAYYGPQTQRAIDNFKISGKTFPRDFIHTIALIKQCAAEANQELGLLAADVARAIIAACREVRAGVFDNQFPVDVFQTGSGTSTNMNVNEVVAARSNEILTGRRDDKTPVHPNDHVNLCQSSNDVIPTAIHVAALTAINHRLLPGLENLEHALSDKATAFSEVFKIGRTHLQDAVPMSLGQEFSGYAGQMASAGNRLRQVSVSLSRLALGGTAVGTGVNAHPRFSELAIAGIARETGLPFTAAANRFEAQATCDGVVEASGQLKTTAISMMKIANDIRLLASGPRCGLGEINLPALQPGSSIMPGKINPVIPEVVMQVGGQVVGNDAAVAVAGQGGYFELNTMLPLAAINLLESIGLLGAAAGTLADKCIKGITANPERCAGNIERSLGMATLLVPHIGYEAAAELAKKAFASGKTVKKVAQEEKIMAEEELSRILSIHPRMINSNEDSI